MFGGVSGSDIADTAVIGSLVVPAMAQRGYPRPFIGALPMPLSIPFLVYAFTALRAFS